MLFWFVAVAVCTVLLVFDSPAVDYRFVAAGGVLPLAEAFIVGSRLMHTLAGSVLLLSVVMGATVGHRLVRRRWLGLPIGTLVFLVAGGVWTRAELFWWPLMGFESGAFGAYGAFFGSWASSGDVSLPEFQRPPAVLLATELIGIAALVWLWQRFDLSDPEHRRRLARTGRLPKDRLGRRGRSGR